MSYYYDTFATSAGATTQTAPQAAVFASFARPRDRVVDIGAGTGALALHLARMGCSVHAAEPSRAMRAVLLSKLAEHPQLRPRITVTGLDTGFGEADYVLLAGVLQCLSPQLRRDLLARAAGCLRPGGLLVLDMVGHTAAPQPKTRVAQVQSGRCSYEMWVESEPLDTRTVRQHIEYRQYLDGAGVECESVLRTVYTHPRDEVNAVLSDLGFALLDEGSQAGLPADFAAARRAKSGEPLQIPDLQEGGQE